MGEQEELYQQVQDELALLDLGEDLPAMHTMQRRHDPRAWIYRLKGANPSGGYSPAFQQITLYEDAIERVSRSRIPDQLDPDDIADQIDAEQARTDPGYLDEQLSEQFDDARSAAKQDYLLSVATHEAVHGYLDRSPGRARALAYTFLGLNDPNVSEAAAQFYTLWHEGKIEDTRERYNRFDAIENSYDHSSYDPGLINQYLAQGLNTYDTADGEPVERARDAMTFFEETYRDRCGRSQLSYDGDLDRLSLFPASFFTGGAIAEAYKGDELGVALFSAVAALWMVNAVARAPAWPDDLDPEQAVTDILERP